MKNGKERRAGFGVKWQYSTVKKEENRKAIDDALGGAVRNPRIPHKWQDQYDRLRFLRERLLGDRLNLINDSNFPVGIDDEHMADVGTDEFERDMDLGLLSADAEALFELEEALRRIERGTYGVCELTGKPIPMARLRAIPWTRFTSEAEKELENAGAIDGAHVGKLGRVETAPAALSRELERVQPQQHEISGEALQKIAESMDRSSDEERLESEDQNS